MGDRTHARVVLYVPAGGFKAGAAAVLGVAKGLPDCLHTVEAGEILLKGGKIEIVDEEANYGQVNGWDAAEWSRALDGIDVDCEWDQGDSYGPGVQYVRGGKLHEFPTLGGDVVVAERWLRKRHEEGATLEDVLKEHAVPDVAYDIGELAVELND